MYRIGILEDDIKTGEELKLFLNTNGYECRFIKPEEYSELKEAELIELLIAEKLSLLLLDIRLPGFDGIRLCKAFRTKTTTPVIMITSDNSEITELLSIQSGADDFVPKPFNLRILLARMEAVLNRVYDTGKKADILSVTLENGDSFIFDSLKGKVAGPQGEEAELSKNEIQILRILLSKKGTIVSREELINELWDNDTFIDDNTLTVNITRLRTRLEQIGIGNAIVTRRGMGYMII